MSTQPSGAWIPEDTFGSRLLRVRHALGMTVDEIAERTGQRPATWSSWERGSMPRNMAAVVAAVALATAADRDWLMWGTGPGSGGLPRLDSNQEPAENRLRALAVAA